MFSVGEGSDAYSSGDAFHTKSAVTSPERNLLAIRKGMLPVTRWWFPWREQSPKTLEKGEEAQGEERIIQKSREECQLRSEVMWPVTISTN